MRPILFCSIGLALFGQSYKLPIAALGLAWLLAVYNKACQSQIYSPQSAKNTPIANLVTTESTVTASSVPASRHMPANGQLSRWDEVGLWVGSLCLLISGMRLFQLWPDVATEDNSDIYIWLSVSLICIVVVAISYRFHRREAHVMTVWRIIREHPDIDVAQLVHDSHLSRASLKRAVRFLNNSGRAFLEWDINRDRIYDTRLNVNLDIVQNCSNCGNACSSRWNLRADELPDCPYCNSPLKLDPMHRSRAEIVSKIRQQNILADEQVAHMRKLEKPFSYLLCFVLFVVYWPMVIFYVSNYVPRALTYSHR